MNKRQQRVRGVAGIGLTWAVVWAPVGAVTGWVTGAALGLPLTVVSANYAGMFGVLGFVAGALFAALLSVAERRRGFDELSLPRFAAWGAVGGLLLGALAATAGLLGAGLTTLGAVMAATSTLLGAGSAAGTLAVARAARGGPLLGPGDVDSPGAVPGRGARGRLARAD